MALTLELDLAKLHVSTRYPNIALSIWKKRLCLYAETIAWIKWWYWKDQVMKQIWMYYKEKLMKNLADLNTFEISMSLTLIMPAKFFNFPIRCWHAQKCFYLNLSIDCHMQLYLL